LVDTTTGEFLPGFEKQDSARSVPPIPQSPVEDPKMREKISCSNDIATQNQQIKATIKQIEIQKVQISLYQEACV
jgi:hypothetical protein